MRGNYAYFKPGAGLAAKIGESVLFIASGINDAPAHGLLETFRNAVASGASGESTVRALASVVAQYGFDSVPAFSCIAVRATELHAITYGDLVGRVRTTQASATLDGANAITWADRRVPGELVEFSVGEPFTGNGWYFTDGMVPAAALSVVVSHPDEGAIAATETAAPAPAAETAAPAPATETAAPAPATEDIEDIDLREPAVAPSSLEPPPGPPPPPPPPVPAPSAAVESPSGAIAPAPLAAERASTVLEREPRNVAGLLCVNGHLTRLDSTECAVCGAPIDRARGTVVGPRPSLGVLRFDDGDRVINLNRPVVVGTSPPDDAVIAGEDAEMVVIDEPRNEVSSVQFEVHYDGWDVFVIDRSTTGTFLDDPGGRRHRLPRHARVKLRPGCTLSFGSHSARMEPPPG